MAELNEDQRATFVWQDPPAVSEWYDLICQFCCVGQHRTAILLRHGLRVAELPFQAHPEIPPGGIPAGPRNGPMFAMLEREAAQAGLRLNWPQRLPDTRRALATAQWVRRYRTSAFRQLHKALFEAHFVLGEDIGDPAVIDRYAAESGIEGALLHAALDDGSAAAAVREAATLARRSGVEGTPAWLLGRHLVLGLQPAEEFERLADEVIRSSILDD